MSHPIRRFVDFTFLICLSAAAALAQPSARTGSGAAWDSEGERVILYGGLTPSDSSRSRYPLDDTWEWNGRRWRQLTPSTTPGPRADFVFVEDTTRSRIILFGGINAPIVPNRPVQVTNDTWAFEDGNWTQLITPTAPPARRLAGAAYDPLRDRIVMFGGSTADGVLFDTWEFDGTNWTLVNASGPRVSSPSLVFDAAHRRTLMLGVGEDNKAVMYAWNGSTWEQLSPATLPSCVTQGNLIFHQQAGRVVYYGGFCSSTGFTSADMFQWDGTTWTEFEPFPTAGGVFSAAVAYDRARNEVVLFGGDDAFGARNTTYRFTNNQWLSVANPHTPGPRSLMVFESDPVNNTIWMFGGQNESQRFEDFWSYSFGRWDRVTATQDAPSGCSYPVGSFDTDRGRLVIVCEDSDVHEWDGTRWYAFPNLTTKPPPRRFSSMTYDARNRRSVLFGGYDGLYLRETWLWNGTSWTRAERDGSPPGRALAALFYDPNQQKVMLYGGIGRQNDESAVVRFNDMWSFDGTKWTKMESVTTPPARYGVYVELHPETNRIVMFGGKNEREQYINELWEWNGTAWTQIDSPGRPSPRMNGMAAWDPSTGAFTLFGGYAGAYFSDVWTFDDGVWRLQQEPETPRRRGASR